MEDCDIRSVLLGNKVILMNSNLVVNFSLPVANEKAVDSIRLEIVKCQNEFISVISLFDDVFIIFFCHLTYPAMCKC